MTIRADFSFSDDAQKIKMCKGHIIGEFTPTEEGGNFRPDKIIILKLIAKNPDFRKIEELAIQHCKVLYDDEETVIDVGSLAEHREKRKVEACKICDNNCGYCKFNCNCSTEVEI